MNYLETKFDAFVKRAYGLPCLRYGNSACCLQWTDQATGTPYQPPDRLLICPDGVFFVECKAVTAASQRFRRRRLNSTRVYAGVDLSQIRKLTWLTAALGEHGSALILLDFQQAGDTWLIPLRAYLEAMADWPAGSFTAGQAYGLFNDDRHLWDWTLGGFRAAVGAAAPE
jgi:hypothetical protein